MFQFKGFRVLAIAAVLVALVMAVGGLVISQAAAGRSDIRAMLYDNAVRFTIENERVALLRAEVFDLAGKRLFDSGPVMGNALDWTMTTEAGERVAHGVYLYVITAWDSQGQLLKSQVGKLALVPGGVGLGQAPPLMPLSQVSDLKLPQVRALGGPNFGSDTIVGGHLNIFPSFIAAGAWGIRDGYFPQLVFGDSGTTYVTLQWYSSADYGLVQTYISGVASGALALQAGGGNVGIGTSAPTATLEVKGSTTNLFVLKDPADNTVFRVEKDGDVYADRAYYCGLSSSSACFQAGSGADVAERIDTSEPVEPGDVVEIDPENPGLYRKAQSAYSSKVAGVISTAPAITLGNAFDAQAEIWEDSRPLLALAGRVPVKATAENGPIGIGDFLTTSSTPGYAMRCAVLSECTGAILGKALEPLEEGTGVIMVQVTLR